jgi:probable HAF family extracellular repeat protein
MAATPSQYAVIDLGIQQAGEGLLWRGLISTAVPFSYPVPQGGTGLIFASNSFAEVGMITNADGNDDVHAAMWRHSGSTVALTDIGVLPGTGAFGVSLAVAQGVNLVGDVVGVSDSAYPSESPGTSGPTQHAFLWNNGVMKDLGTMAGNGYFSSAEAVNDSHEVVGWTNTISTATGAALQRAFVYINGTMYNLTFYLIGGPAVLLSEASAIDCQGNISAVGTPASGGSGKPHNYLLIRQGSARTCPK